ncbi:MAG: TraR/DksA C4-type zinc finger protein [Candidatus Buchananbacteria bacterium]
MDKIFIDEIKEKLIQEQERSQRELAKFSKKSIENDASREVIFPDFGDKEDENAEEVATYTTNLSLEKKLEETLRDVAGALKRIAEGKYGICKFCGQEIDKSRLLARPVSSSCVSCKKSLKGENIK